MVGSNPFETQSFHWVGVVQYSDKKGSFTSFWTESGTFSGSTPGNCCDLVEEWKTPAKAVAILHLLKTPEGVCYVGPTRCSSDELVATKRVTITEGEFDG